MLTATDNTLLLEQALVLIEEIRASIGDLPVEKLAVVHERLEAIGIADGEAKTAIESLCREIVDIARTRQLC